MNHTCGECFFFGVHTKHRHAGTRGECRAHLFVTFVKDRGFDVEKSFYPARKQSDDSCGEFQAMPPVIETEPLTKKDTDTCLSDYTVNKIKQNQS